MPKDPYRSALQAVAGLIESDVDEQAWLRTLVVGALDALPQFDHVSITIRSKNHPLETIASTDELARRGDEIQAKLLEGPCYDATTAPDHRFSEVLGTDQKWPTYGPRVARLGIVSQLALHLNLIRGPRASLNLYADRRVELDDVMLEVAGLFAASMANVLGLVRTVDQLQTALGTSRTIGQAIGIVMGRYQVSQERALGFLVRLSQNNNLKLSAVAQQIVIDQGDLASTLHRLTESAE